MQKWNNQDEDGQYNRNTNRGLFEKFLNLFGFEAEEIVEEEEESLGSGPYQKAFKERGKLLSLTNANNKTVKLIVVEPLEFEDVQTLVEHLKNKRAVILNLEETDKAIARRIVDFLGGAIYALEGTMQKISGSIFLFTPAHIEVSVPVKPEIREKEKEREKGPLPSTLSSTIFRDRER